MTEKKPRRRCTRTAQSGHGQHQHLGVWLRHALEVAATMAFTLSGVMVAARSRLDAVGVYAVAFLAAFGGGTLRDLLLDQRPFFWVRHVEYLWGVLALSTAAMLFMRRAGSTSAWKRWPRRNGWR